NEKCSRRSEYELQGPQLLVRRRGSTNTPPACDHHHQQGGIMLFGVRVTEGGVSFRKRVGMNNLSQYEHPQEISNAADVAAGYESDDVVHASGMGEAASAKEGCHGQRKSIDCSCWVCRKSGKETGEEFQETLSRHASLTQVASHAQNTWVRLWRKKVQLCLNHS
ncbi:hypothetical protein Tsubulata_034398, partial [Turnera subulata]